MRLCVRWKRAGSRGELNVRSSGEFVRPPEWAKGHVSQLEAELTTSGIAEALGEQELVPEPIPWRRRRIEGRFTKKTPENSANPKH